MFIKTRLFSLTKSAGYVNVKLLTKHSAKGDKIND